MRRFCLLLTLAGCMVLIGCQAGDATAPLSVGPLAPVATSNPAIMGTLHADVAQTAAWIGTLTPAGVATPTQAPLLNDILTGTPVTQRGGTCPVPDQFTLHQRDGFCIAAPMAWIALNVDGGMAGSLRTTPGQAISLQPDWADTTAVCHLMIFIASANSIAQYLGVRHSQFEMRSDLKSLSAIGAQSLGEAGMEGFVWADTSGGQGGVYAAMLGPNRLLHISWGGTNCAVEQLFPAIDTLRVN